MPILVVLSLLRVMLDRPRLRLDARFDAPVMDIIDIDVRDPKPPPRPPELLLWSPSVDEEASPHSEEMARLCPSRRGRAEAEFAEVLVPCKDGSCRSEIESSKKDVPPDGAELVCLWLFKSGSEREPVPSVLPPVVAIVLSSRNLGVSRNFYLLCDFVSSAYKSVWSGVCVV